MNLLDLVIILAAIAYAIGGFRSGAVVGIFSLIGFFGGAAIGAQLARPLGSQIASGKAQVPVAIFCVLVLATLGQLLGVYIAGHIRARVVPESARAVDAGIGAALGILSVLLVAWMIAVPLASSSYPRLSAEATHSRIVRSINDVMPSGVRDLYSSLRGFLDRSGFPPVFGDLPSTSIVGVAAPPANLSPEEKRAVQTASDSVFKVLGAAPECGRDIEGSGFVYAPHRVLTNAHVVAGTKQVVLQVSNSQRLPAKVVLFDPDKDVAVLDVPGLDAPALHFTALPAKTGDPALVLGYPENGPFTVKTARIRAKGEVSGTNIYGGSSVDRSIYSVRAVVRSGNSGGPLLADDGTVLGMVFATATDSPDTGFALADDEITSSAAAGRTRSTAVGTGTCTPD